MLALKPSTLVLVQPVPRDLYRPISLLPHSSVRIDIRKKETITDGKAKDAATALGNKVRAKVVKNKVAPPHK